MLPAAEATGDDYDEVVTADTPDAYWRLGESSGTTGADASGNGHTLTYTGMTLGRPGAIAGDTDTSVAVAPNVRATASLGTYTPANVSLEIWLRTVTVPNHEIPAVIVSPNGSGTVDLRMGIAATTGGAFFTVRIAGTLQRVASTVAITDGAWHHLVGVYDGSAVMIYVDGQLGGTLAASGSRTSGTSRTMVLGNPTFCGGSLCTINGDVDEIALYGHALSATDVANHDAAGGTHDVGCTATDAYSKIICAQKPVGYWRLGDAATSTPATDQTSLGNHGSYRTTTLGPLLGAAGAISGNPNTAMRTNAQNQAMVIPYDPYGHFASPQASIEGWLNITSMNSWTNQDAFAVGGTNSRFGITINATTKVVGGHFKIGTTNWSITGTTAVTVGTWNHLALTYDGQVARLYVNGQPAGTGSVAGRLAPCINCTGTAGAPLNCGGDCAPIGYFDEVALYDKALTAAELAVRPFGAAPSWPKELRSGGNPALDYQPCVCVDPVVPATGALVESLTDIAIPGRGPGLAFTRSYDSTDATTAGVLGYGWRHNYQMSLGNDATLAGAKAVTQENGSVVPFAPAGGGDWIAASRARATLEQNPNGTWRFVRRNKEIFDFDSSGKLTAISDLNGHTTTLAYTSGRLATVTDDAGRVLTLGYDTSGRITTVTDPASRVVTYTYNTAGDLVGATDPTSETWDYAYDTAHRLTTSTDPLNAATTTTYDTAGRVATQADALNRVTSFSYTPVGTTTITDPRGGITVQHYDQYLLVDQTDASGTAYASTTEYTYDAETLGVATKTDGLDHVWTYTYDSRGNRLTATNPEQETESWTYNGLDQVLTHTDAADVTTTTTYDTSGNPLTTSRPLVGTTQNRLTTFVYGDTLNPGDVTSIVDARGKTTTRTYDQYGQLVATSDPLGRQATYAYQCTTGCYNNIGWVYKTVSPRGYATGANATDFTTVYTRDALGRETSVTDTLGKTITMQYDAAGNRILATDQLSRDTAYTYNLARELTTITRADTTTLVYTYDNAGNRITSTDGDAKTTTSAFDLLRRRTSVTDPENRTTTFTYDLANRVVQMTDPDSGTVTLGYDDAGRLLSRSYSDTATPDVTYTYDATGRRLTMVDGTGTTTYTYDSLGRLTDTEDGAAQDVHYEYDLGGLVTSITYPNGLDVDRVFDDAGQLESVTDWNGAMTTFAHDENGGLKSITYPNGVVESTTRDREERITNVSHVYNPSTMASYDSTRGDDGRVETADETGVAGTASDDYYYDDLHQLTSVTTGGPAAFGYDGADNPTTFGGATQTFDDANQLLTSTAGGGTTFTYNARGARTTAVTSTTTTTYGYDQANRLTSYTGAASATYAYDGDGLRASKTTGGATRSFTWDRVGPWPLLLNDGVANYVYGPGGLPISQIATVPATGFVASGTTIDTSTTAGSVVVTLSATAQQHDQILVAVNKSAVQQVTTPTGYTLVDEYPVSQGTSETVLYRKTATGGESGVTVSFGTGNGDPRSVTAVVYRGIDPVDPIEDIGADSVLSGTTVAPQGVQVAAAGGMLVLFQHALGSTSPAGWTPDTTMTERADVSAADIASAVADEAITDPQTVGSRTSTLSVTGEVSGILVALRRAPTTYYVHHDQHGSTRILTNPAGQVAGTYQYDAFGATTAHTGTVGSALQYTGEYRDAESGLYYLRARYYDPATGQFLTRDLLALVTGSPYGYAMNDPINGADPTGLICLKPSCVIDAVTRTAATAIHMLPEAQLLDAVSQATGLTLGGCVGGTLAIRFEVTASVCYVATPSGESGLSFTGGYGFGTNIGASALVGPTVSNGQSLSDLAGPFNYVAGSGGVGPYGAGGSYQWGENKCGDSIWQVTVGWSPQDPGFGFSGGGTWTKTSASYW